MEELKVAVTLDENYIYPLKVMLHSLFSTQKEPVTVFLVHSRIRKQRVGEIRLFCKKYGAGFKEIRLEKDVFQYAPVKRYFTVEMYYRLLLPWLLPDEERILYLDSDMVINRSLHALWNIDFEGASLAAVADRGVMSLKMDIAPELKNSPFYVNSGVLMMNLCQIRQELCQERIFKLIAEKESDFVFPDQDLINILWRGKIKRLDSDYNFDPNCLYLKEHLFMMWKKHKIIHFMGSDKPWNASYKGNWYLSWAKNEWSVYPQKRCHIIGRILMEPYWYLYGIYRFVKNHNWKDGG